MQLRAKNRLKTGGMDGFLWFSRFKATWIWAFNQVFRCWAVEGGLDEVSQFIPSWPERITMGAGASAEAGLGYIDQNAVGNQDGLTGEFHGVGAALMDGWIVG